MSVIDILTRVDSICKKYDKYDIDKQKDLNLSGDDAFARLYASIEADIEAALQVRFLSISALRLVFEKTEEKWKDDLKFASFKLNWS